MTDNIYLTDVEAAKIMSLSVQTLRNWRCSRRGPSFTKCGRSVRYSQAAIEQFMNENKVETQERF